MKDFSPSPSTIVNDNDFACYHQNHYNPSGFSILNFLDRLEPTKVKDKYICPVCGGNDLSVDAKTGAYQCWHGCEVKDIREAVAPWDEVKKDWQPVPRQRKKTAARSQKTPPLPKGNLSLATLPSPATDIPKLQKASYVPPRVMERVEKAGSTCDRVTDIEYHYSDKQAVIRYQWPDHSNPKGHDKTFSQWHLGDGEKVWGKGEEPWPAYRLDEVLARCPGKLVLGQEGESCVEMARALGIVSLTLQGSNWSEEEWQRLFSQLKAAGSVGYIHLTDNDEAGKKKADKGAAAAAKEDFPFLAIPISQIYPDCPPKGDLIDWVDWGKGKGMSVEDFIRQLEKEIHAAVNARQQEQQQPEEELSQADLLRLEMKNYLQASDIVEREILRGKICSTYRLTTKSFNAIAESLDSQSAKPKARLLTPEQFMNLETGGGAWLIPGLIPAVGVMVLAGNPGAGKTTLAYDAAAAVIYGEAFLNETPTKRGSVLFVASDELPAFGQDKLVNRAIQGNYSFLLDWDVSQWSELDAALDTTRPSLVIVDSFNGIHNDPDFDENSALASQSVKKLEKLSNKYSVPILLIHHLNKSKENKGVNRVRGSSAIAASCSAIAILEGEGTVKRFYQPKIRGSEPLNLRVEMEAETGHFKVLEGNFADDATKSLSERLLAFFTANGGKLFERPEILSQFPGTERATLWKALERLVKRGQIVRRQSKTNWRCKVWGVTVNCEKLSLDITAEKGGLPPPPTPAKVSSETDETFVESEFLSLDTSLDTHSTLTRHPNPCPVTESFQEASFHHSTPNTPQGGGEGVSTENQKNSVGQTVTGINTQTVKLNKGDRAFDTNGQWQYVVTTYEEGGHEWAAIIQIDGELEEPDLSATPQHVQVKDLFVS